MNLEEDGCSVTSMQVDSATTPSIGMQFENLNDAHEVWKAYGREMGFNVRIQNQRKSNKNPTIIISALYECSKARQRREDNRSSGSTNHRWETKTDCKVKLVVTLEKKTGKYTVTKFDRVHNHVLQPKEAARMLRECRHVSDAHAAAIDIAQESGMTPKATHEFMAIEAGGRHKLGYIFEDQKTHLKKLRGKNTIADCEYQSIEKYVEKRKSKNKMFQYYEQCDSDRYATNLFWSDHGMLADYDAFGDVLIFDTTFGTNKEMRPLGNFAGFNHHRQIVIFGATLLYEETMESFSWLFETFFKANGDKKPKTIFTDQDAAMAAALKPYKKEIHHALCVFHIWNNALDKLGKVTFGDITLLENFQRCIHEYDDEVWFEEEWQLLLERFNMHDNSWLKSIYAVKEKWAICFTKKHFTLGVRSTQICESVNADMKTYITRKLSMDDFLKHFDRVVDGKREKEKLFDFHYKNAAQWRRYPATEP